MGLGGGAQGVGLDEGCQMGRRGFLGFGGSWKWLGRSELRRLAKFRRSVRAANAFDWRRFWRRCGLAGADLT